MNQNDLFCNAAEQQGVCGGGVAPAHHHNGLAPVKHPVTGGAVGHAPAHQRLLVVHTQLSWVGSGGKNDCLAQKGPLAGLQHLGAGGEIQPLHLGVLGPRAEPPRLGLHLLRQGEAVYTVLKAGVVVDLLGQRHLSPGGQLLQDQRVQARPRGVEGGGIAAGPSADDDHIVNVAVCHGNCLLLTPRVFPE